MDAVGVVPARAWHRTLVILAALLPLLGGCGVLAPSRVAPPEAVQARAVAAGLPEARQWGDDLDPERRARSREVFRRALLTSWEERGRPPEGLDIALLALSGGGSNGAFAAGLLVGWSERGDRPEFDVVTGISAGALVAPFAFAGAEFDETLTDTITEIDAPDVAQLQIFRAIFGALGIAGTDPLRRKLERLIDERLLARIAERHAGGARLLIGTTNIDAARPVIWDMGLIAAAGRIELFREVVLASASIPGAFPPVAIEVEADGEPFTEFHVDGNVTQSVFIGPVRAAEALPRDLPFPVARTVYIVLNNTPFPVYEPVDERLVAIVRRSLGTLIRAQSAGDLIRIHLAAQEAGAAFRLAYLPAALAEPPGGAFDGAHIRAVFDVAREQARAGTAWLDQPPALLGRGALEADRPRPAG